MLRWKTFRGEQRDPQGIRDLLRGLFGQDQSLAFSVESGETGEAFARCGTGQARWVAVWFRVDRPIAF